MITDAVIELYDRIVDRNLLVRRINITANRLVDESSVKKEEAYEQLDLFTDYEAQRKKQEEEEAALNREKRCLLYTSREVLEDAGLDPDEFDF